MVNAKTFKDGFTWLTKGSKGRYPIILDKDGMHFGYENKLNHWLTLTYKVQGVDEKVIIPYAEFAGLKKMFKYWKSELKFMVNQLNNTDFRVSISDGEHVFSYTYDNRMVPTNEYPSNYGLPFAEGIFNVNDLAESASRLIPFASIDTMRYFMCGVYIDSENKALVATDGRRLGYLSFESELPSMIVPGDAFVKIEGMGEVIYTVSNEEKNKYLKIENDEKSVTVRLIDGQFPNWKRVVPPTETDSIKDVVNLDSFLKASKYAADIADKTGRTRLSDGRFADVEYTPKTNIDGIFYINATYLKETLEKMMGENVDFYAQVARNGEVETEKAITITDGTLNAIIMPMCAA